MSSRQLWLAVLIAAALLRLATLPAYPLHDTTEARYAEIARLMVVSDDWVTPQVAPGVPFWAKPPLSSWVAAASIKLFGAQRIRRAFAVVAVVAADDRRRLASRAGGAFDRGGNCRQRNPAHQHHGLRCCRRSHDRRRVGVLDHAVAGRVLDRRRATALAAGAYLFSSASRSGLLAKGPVALVLVGLPILAWSLWQKNIAWLWRALPWMRGSLLMLAIAAPWYVLAENGRRVSSTTTSSVNTGMRFVDSGWQGDLYGDAHARTRGTIWVYGVLAALPWSPLALDAAGRHARAGGLRRSLEPWRAYLLLWTLAPLVFFTFAGNILAAYILPGLPAFALLLGDYLVRRERQFARLGLLVPALLVVAILSGAIEYAAIARRKTWSACTTGSGLRPQLRYFPKLPLSASFYSAGARAGDRDAAEIADFTALRCRSLCGAARGSPAQARG